MRELYNKYKNKANNCIPLEITRRRRRRRRRRKAQIKKSAKLLLYNDNDSESVLFIGNITDIKGRVHDRKVNMFLFHNYKQERRKKSESFNTVIKARDFVYFMQL